jgi:hypothetical protein
VTDSTESDAADSKKCYLLVGGRWIILARRWEYGDQSGFSAERIYARIDDYENSQELADRIQWPDASSEAIARGLASGELAEISTLPTSRVIRGSTGGSVEKLTGS